MEVPEAAIRWLTINSSSNMELAILSNVNRSWRQQVAAVVVEVADQTEEYDAPVASLLLPTMARQMFSERSTSSSENENDSGGSFCLAWFPPMGIKILSVQLGESLGSDEDTDHHNESCTDAFAPSGGPSYEGSGEEKKKHVPAFRTLAAASSRIASQVGNAESRRQTCSHEWQGYRVPMDVLRPFGYASDFINYVLLPVSKGRASEKTEEEISIPLQQTQIAQITNSKLSSNEHLTTYAVRGATFARPDGYCLCWDADDHENSEGDSDKKLTDWEMVQRQEQRRSKAMRVKRRRDLQHLVLPRMVLSTKEKQPPENTTFSAVGRRQRSLQFLNAEGSHAVRIMTPPFACGPVQGPVTVFCVAIATEDGCFFSGLKRRYELGHMYPCDPRDALVDMSPICLVTDRASPAAVGSPKSRLEDYSRTNSFDSDDSSCDSYDDARKTMRDFGVKCECPIADTHMGTSLSNYAHDDEDAGDPRDEDIFRGRMGPGLWHCYVAVFDGENSLIRIDGRSEHLDSGYWRNDSNSISSSSSSSVSRGEAALDGLTIGADHCFDMSLCYGDGMSGEGEGAISELAAFKGRMPTADIEQMERYLMEKHGIPSPTSEPTTPEQEDEWRRQAHALIVQPPPWKLEGEPVPLRVVTKHRSVAWHLKNVVTGKVIPVSRIGSKHSTGSSGW